MQGWFPATERLSSFSHGNRSASETVLSRVLPKLRQIASRALRGENRAVSVSPSDLVQELWLRNLGKSDWQCENERHLYFIAARAMRQILVDMGRRRSAQRRHGGVRISLDSLGPGAEPRVASAEDVVKVMNLIGLLEKTDPATARIVDMHYVTGFTLEEIAKNTGLTLRQVRHRWEKGQAWLKRRFAA